MTRQAIVRILLSLLLLASQQMASLHVLSHLTGSSGGGSARQAERDNALSSAIAQDQSCSHCLALAQLAGPLPSTPPAFMLPAAGASAVGLAAAHPAGARTILAFHSRGPPLA